MRAGRSLLELLVALAVLGIPLAALRPPPHRRRGPDDRLARAMEWILRDVARAGAVTHPASPAARQASAAATRLALVGPEGSVVYELAAGRLRRRVRTGTEAPWLTSWEIPLEAARFQARRLSGPGIVVRVRLLRGRDLLLSGARLCDRP